MTDSWEWAIMSTGEKVFWLIGYGIGKLFMWLAKLGLLALAVWIVVKVLQAMGVL